MDRLCVCVCVRVCGYVCVCVCVCARARARVFVSGSFGKSLLRLDARVYFFAILAFHITRDIYLKVGLIAKDECVCIGILSLYIL